MQWIRNCLRVTAVTLLLITPATAQLQTGLPDQSELGRFGLTRSWWGQASLNPYRDSIRHFVVDEELVYVQASSGMVTAFDNESGKQLWSIQLGNSDQPMFPARSNEDLVLIISGTYVYALTKFEGDLLWQLVMPGQPSASAAIDEDRVFIPFLDGSIYAFNLKRIRELYNDGLLPDYTTQTIDWRFKTQKPVTTAPLSNGRVVNFATFASRLYTITAPQREVVFQYRSDAPVSAPIASDETYLYMASQDNRLYAIDRNNGQVRWAPFTVGLPIRKAPVVIGDTIFLTPVRGGMYTVSTSSGLEKWPWRPEPVEFLAANDKMVFTSDQVGNVLMLDRQNEGKPLGTLALREYSVRTTNSRTDRLYMATPRGRVICIRDLENQYPIYHQYPERRPLLPQLAPDDTDPAATNPNP